MTAPTSVPALEQYPVFTLLPKEVREPWLTTMRDLGDKARPVVDEEVFESKDQCLKRLNAWGFSEGSYWVIAKSRPGDLTPTYQFRCLYWGKKTQNRRELQEAQVQRNDQGTIVSQRQRNTSIRKLGCTAFYRLSYRLIDSLSSSDNRDGERHYIGYWVEKHHVNDDKLQATIVHSVPCNPFDIHAHRHFTQDLRKLKPLARTFRFNKQPYLQAMKLLATEGHGLTLSTKEYYNLIRNEPLQPGQEKSIAGLLQALQDAGFASAYRTHDEYHSVTNKLLSRQMIQIVFWLEDGEDLIKRFCSGSLLQVDCTWNTNRYRMPLMTSIGVTNEGHRFPVALFYCPQEDALSYSFFFEVLRLRIFKDPIPEPAVVLTDASGGMFKAVNDPELRALPNSFHQLCTWHVQQAMMAHFRKTGYTEDELKGAKDSDEKEDSGEGGLHQASWAWIQATTEQELEASRSSLLALLQVRDQLYVQQQWVPKESQFIHWHTSIHANLGKHATSMNEGFNRVIKNCANGQMSLEKSATELCKSIKYQYDVAWRVETYGLTHYPLGCDDPAFNRLRGKISQFAIKAIFAQYTRLDAEQAEASDYDLDRDYDSCSCMEREQLSLPCVHTLTPFLRDQLELIPLSLIHPRWRLKPRHSDEWFIAPVDWQPSYNLRVLVSPRKVNAQADFIELMRVRDSLPEQERTSYDNEVNAMLSALRRAGEQKAKRAAVPIAQPEIVPKKVFQRKRKATMNSRALTANEIAEAAQVQQQRAAEREARVAANNAAVLQQRQQQSGQEEEHLTSKSDSESESESEVEQEEDSTPTSAQPQLQPPPTPSPPPSPQPASPPSTLPPTSKPPSKPPSTLSPSPTINYASSKPRRSCSEANG